MRERLEGRGVGGLEGEKKWKGEGRRVRVVYYQGVEYTCIVFLCDFIILRWGGLFWGMTFSREWLHIKAP